MPGEKSVKKVETIASSPQRANRQSFPDLLSTWGSFQKINDGLKTLG